MCLILLQNMYDQMNNTTYLYLVKYYKILLMNFLPIKILAKRDLNIASFFINLYNSDFFKLVFEVQVGGIIHLIIHVLQ
jgi:hypothetical protein